MERRRRQSRCGKLDRTKSTTPHPKPQSPHPHQTMTLAQQANPVLAASVLHAHWQHAQHLKHIPLTRLMCCRRFATHSSSALTASSPGRLAMFNAESEVSYRNGTHRSTQTTHVAKKPAPKHQRLRSQFSSPPRQQLPREAATAKDPETRPARPRRQGPVNCDGVLLDRFCPTRHILIRGRP